MNVGTPFSKNKNSGRYDPSADKKKSIPAIINDFLRPRRVAMSPEIALPIMQPINALDDVSVEKISEREEYDGMCDVVNLGVSLIFHMNHLKI